MMSAKPVNSYTAVLLVVFTGWFSALYAQVDLFPASYGIVGESRGIYNPALINTNAKYSANLGNQFFPGTYNQLENHFLTASINISGDSAKNRNNIGFKIITEKEGEYIFRPKIYISYAWHTGIYKDYHLGAGVNIGYAGYNYKATAVSAEGSAYGPDADVGIAVYNPLFTLGIALNQALNTVITPKLLPFRLKRFYSINIEKRFTIAQKNSIILNYQRQSVKSFHQNNCFGLHILMQRLLLVGIYYLPNERLTFTLGIQDFTLEKHRFSVVFGYNTPLKISAQSNIQSFEIMLAYKHL